VSYLLSISSVNSKSTFLPVSYELPVLTTIGETGVHSLWLRCSAANTFLDDGSDAVRQRTCQGYAFARWAFFGVVLVLSYWPPNFSEGTEKFGKISFGEKRLLNGKCSKFRYERTHRHIDSRISAKFRGNRGKAEVAKRVRGIHQEKDWYFARLYGLWSDVTQNFTKKSLFLHSSSFFAKFCPNPSSFRVDISKNVFQTPLKQLYMPLCVCVYCVQC